MYLCDLKAEAMRKLGQIHKLNKVASQLASEFCQLLEENSTELSDLVQYELESLRRHQNAIVANIVDIKPKITGEYDGLDYSVYFD